MTTINDNSSQRNKEQRMELFNDFSFKYIFRRESQKNLLITFLNDLLQGDKIISEIEYGNSELQAEFKEGRDCLFDIV